jgi:molybdopterin-containing oxidoreductase family membrane subunit
MTFTGVWIEKGMGMVVPGFVPSTMHELVEYVPSLTEWKLTVGIWAMGIGIFTVAVKIATHMLTGRSGLGPAAPFRGGKH